MGIYKHQGPTQTSKTSKVEYSALDSSPTLLVHHDADITSPYSQPSFKMTLSNEEEADTVVIANGLITQISREEREKNTTSFYDNNATPALELSDVETDKEDSTKQDSLSKLQRGSAKCSGSLEKVEVKGSIPEGSAENDVPSLEAETYTTGDIMDDNLQNQMLDYQNSLKAGTKTKSKDHVRSNEQNGQVRIKTADAAVLDNSKSSRKFKKSVEFEDEKNDEVSSWLTHCQKEIIYVDPMANGKVKYTKKNVKTKATNRGRRKLNPFKVDEGNIWKIQELEGQQTSERRRGWSFFGLFQNRRKQRKQSTEV